MAKRKITDYFLYRYRFGLSTLLIFIALIGLLTVALLVPGGITPIERASVITAMRGNTFAVDSPYYMAQHALIGKLGLSALSIKLASIALGFVSGIGIFFLLKRWLPAATAIFASLLIISSTTFISLCGTGSPAILYVLYPTLLLLFGTRVLAPTRGLVLFTILLLMTTAAALLTPTLCYLVVLALVITISNPHVRYGFRRLPRPGLILLMMGFVASLAPVVLTVYRNPAVIKTLLGIPSHLSFGTIAGGVGSVVSLFGGFLHPGLIGGMIAPVVGLATCGLAVLGLYHIVRAMPSARSQFLIGWSVIAVAVALINPALAVVLYLPVMLLAAFGLAQVIAVWYRTFPLNPYARVSAMLPIGILILGIVAGSSLRYVNTTLYAQGSAQLYSQDLRLLTAYMSADTTSAPLVLAVDPDEQGFYAALHSVGSHRISTTSFQNAALTSGTIISSQALGTRTDLKRIITDGRASGADRFYVYAPR